MAFAISNTLTRIIALGTIVAAPVLATEASAQRAEDDAPWVHASALVGEPQYPPDFERFDYVNPDAPKGGTLELSETGSFDTLNPILTKGEVATGLGLVYESLTTSSLDEISADYGLLAEALSYPEDYAWVKYRLREGARWHDGEPVTAEDVVWSFDKLVELNPTQRFYYQHVVQAEALDDRTVLFTFDEKNNKELPHIVGQVLVLPKHWWTATDAQGNQRDIASSTLEPPLGSGPYRITEVNAGSSVTFTRVEDYWGRDLPVNVGKHNFGEIGYTYFRDRDVEFQAFKAGEFDFWSENEAKRWATAYDFPAVEEGRIKREVLENAYRTRGILVGFIPNLRREMFQDPRVRRALNQAFDFETLNETIFYDQYERVDSFFYGTPLAHEGAPEGRELEILNEVRGQVPDSVFEGEYENPVAGSQQALRDNLREAVRLFREAGYELRDGQMVDSETGEPFEFELLLNGPIIERVALPYAEDLRKIGVTMNVRSVEPSQFVTRLRARDFDMIYSGWAQSLSPGNEQFDYFGSASADREGSRNYGGVADPAVDALIEEVVFAPDRDDLIAATRALDRVLMAQQFVIPSYTARNSRIAYWNKFDHPDPLPFYSIGFPTVWWYDADKAEAIQ
ncbi:MULTISPECIES: extracellular solute-binding protein [unclassified Roseitalea]|uniref:extracellular solute-binding protein n=1 Tax=unclassified Roseitalea TaxID=2639107 RepID=UPI00274004FD|nr:MULTISPECIES: extracellular solute-binding protein [unclassified Roseitalea]